MKKHKKIIEIILLMIILIFGIGISEDKKEIEAIECPFFGTWRIEKVAVISDMYTGTTLDGVLEEDLYDSEDFVGYELEYTADYFRIGENTYTDPEYGMFFEDIFTVNDGGRFWPHVCDFMEEEGIDWHDDKYYGQRDGMELHLLVYIDFEETVFYETYDFIPVGTLFTLLNEDTMLVEFWGKTLLARRVA